MLTPSILHSIRHSVVIALFTFSGAVALAQQPATWIGPANGDWVDSGGAAWSSGAVPNSAAADVRIDNNAGQNSALTIQASAPSNGLTITAGRLTIDAGDLVTFGSNKRLNMVPGGFAGAGSLVVNGTLALPLSSNSFSGVKTISGTGIVQLGGVGGQPEFTDATTNSAILQGSALFGRANASNPQLINSGTINANLPSGDIDFHGQGGANRSINTGTLKASGGGKMQFGQGEYLNTGGSIIADGAGSVVAFYRGGLTEGGTISAINGGLLQVGGSFHGSNGGHTFRNVTQQGPLTLQDTLSLQGSYTNNGTTTIGDGRLMDIAGGESAVTVAGAGDILLNAAIDGSPELISQGNSGLPSVTWTFQNQTVHGRGDVGYVNSGGAIDNVQIINQGTFQADVDGQTLRLDVANFDNRNGGVLRATGSGNTALGGILRLSFNGALKNTGGTIEALNGGRIEATAARIEGGLIRNGRPDAVPPVPGGSIPLAGMAIVNPSVPDPLPAPQPPPYRDADPNGMLLQGDIAVGNTGYNTSSVPRLVGEIKNSGKLRLAATGSNTSYLFLSETAKKYVAFTGGGEVILGTMPDGSLGNDSAFLIESIDGGFATRTLNNVDNTIHGFGRIGADPLYGYYLNIENTSLIAANVSGRTLGVVFNGGTNTGGIYRAQNGGTLSMRTTNLLNTGGVLEALNESPFKFTSAVITGGTLRNVGAAAGATNFDLGEATLTDLTLQGPMVQRNGATTTLVGAIQNEGSIRVRSTGSNTLLAVGSAAVTAVSLNGPGELILGDPALGASASANSYLTASGNSNNPTLTLNQNLRGFGYVGTRVDTTRVMHLVNNAEIRADVNGKQMRVAPTSLVNSPGKLMTATNGGNLYLHPIQLTNTNATIRAGVNSTVQFNTQAIVDGGVVDSEVGGTIEVLNNLAARNGVLFTNAGTLLLGTGNNNSTFEGLANGGSSLDSSGTIRKSGGGDYSLRTGLNNTGAVDVQGGVLRFFGGGTISSSLHGVAANSHLTFQGSPGYTFTGTSTLSGGGTNWFASGVTITLPTEADKIEAANLNFQTATLTGPGVLAPTALGPLLTHSGRLTFVYETNNTISGARIVTQALATASIEISTYAPLRLTNGTRWDNYGEVIFSNSGFKPTLTGTTGTKLTNHVGGVIRQEDEYDGFLDMELDNQGQLQVQRGRLYLSKNSSWTGGTANIPTGTEIWNSSTMTFNGMANASTGAGWLYTNGASVLSFTAGSRLTAERLSILDSAGVSGPGELVVTKAAEWRPPSGVTQVINNTQVQLLVDSLNRLDGSGTLRLQNGAIIRNAGTMDMRQAFRLELNTGGIFENAGTVTATSGGNNPSFGGDGTGLLRTLENSTTRFFPSNGNSYTIGLPFDFAGLLYADSGMNLTFDQGGLFNETAKIWPNHPSSNITFTGATKVYRSRGQAVEFSGTGYVNLVGTTLQFEPSTIMGNESRISAGARVAFHGNNTVKSVAGMQGRLSATGFVFANGTQTVDNAILETTGTVNDSVWNATGEKLQLINGAKFVNGGRFVIAFRVGSGVANDPGITGNATTLFHNTATGRLVHDSSTLTEFGLPFRNDGYLEFIRGSINFRGGFSGNGGVAVSGGAKVDLGSTTFSGAGSLPSGLQASGAGSELKLTFANGVAYEVNNPDAVKASSAAKITLQGGEGVKAKGANASISASGPGSQVLIQDADLVGQDSGSLVGLDSGSLQVNGGAIRVDSSASLTANGGNVQVTGTAGITAASGASILSHNGGQMVNAGGMNVEDNATVQAANGGSIVNAGGMNVDGASAMANGGNIKTNGAAGIAVTNGGSLVAAGGGNLVAAGGGNIVSNHSSRLVAAGGGNIKVEGGGSLVAAGGGNLVAAGGGNLVNAGGLNVAGKTKTTSVSGAEIRAENGGHIWGSGTCQGAGVIQSGGLLHPGTAEDMTPSPGVLTWTGDLNIQNGGIFEVELGGTTAGTGHDKVTVSGALIMDGVLRVRFLNGFQTSIQSSHTFTIATAGSAITGTIDNLTSGRVTTADGRGSFAVSFANSGKDLVLSGFQAQAATFNSWLAQNNLTGNDALPTADVDFDGLNNLLEYALGRDPRAADGGLGTTGEAEVGGQKYLSWTYTRPNGVEVRSDITYTGERSNTLLSNSWDSATVLEDSVIPDATLPFETVRIRSTVPMTQIGNSPELLRLKVTQSP